MKSHVTHILVEGGYGLVWRARPGTWRWQHPDGSEGSAHSFEAAAKQLEAIEPHNIQKETA